MTETKTILKWFTAPLLILVAQIALDTIDAFDSDIVLWAFSVLSILTLFVWRSRLGKALKVLMPPDGYPNLEPVEVKQVSLSDRRFAVISMMFPYAILLLAQLAIVVVLSLDLATVRTHFGSIVTIVGVLAIGFHEIAMFIRYLIVIHSTRWQRILKRDSTRWPAP